MNAKYREVQAYILFGDTTSNGSCSYLLSYHHLHCIPALCSGHKEGIGTDGSQANQGKPVH